MPEFAHHLKHLLGITLKFLAEVAILVLAEFGDYAVDESRREYVIFLEVGAIGIKRVGRSHAAVGQRLERSEFLLILIVVDIDGYILILVELVVVIDFLSVEGGVVN